jgi:hypothetical protein
MSISDRLELILREPTPERLWQLRGDLMIAAIDPQAPALHTLNQAFRFFSELASKSTAREYSHFASLLDITAVGVVVISGAKEAVEEGTSLLGTLLTAALSEGFMVLAARQYVKAWEEEMHSVYQQAAWELYQQFWLLSVHMQDSLPTEQRRSLLDNLLQPAFDKATPGTVRALLIGRLYQLLLLIQLSDAVI